MRKLMNLCRSRRRRMEHDLDRGLRYHLERRVDDLMKAGLSDSDAWRQAAVEFGGVAQVQEEVRDTWFWRWLQNVGRDMRYAVRVMSANPGFTVTAILSLALGIGANTAIFSILHALVLRSLPVSDPQRLVIVTRNETVSSPYPLFLDIRDQSQSLEGVLAFRTTPMRLSKGNETERITGALVSGSYFDVLGVRPFIGTTIAKEDDQKPGSGGWRGPVAVLSHSFWIRGFGGQTNVIGTRILLNAHPFTVAGVAPPGFSGTEVGESPDVFAPMTMQEALLPGLGKALTQPRSQWLRILGRLKAGIDLRHAEAELTTLVRRYNAEIIQGGDIKDAGRRRGLMEQKIVLLPGNSGISQLRRQYSKPLWILTAVVGLVLLIACANMASLLLSRATARRREIAIRLSLGADRSRLVSQLFTESLLLAVAGAGSGLLLARWLRDALIRYLPPDRSLAVPIDLNALLFTLALAVAAALLCGLAPAVQSTKVDLAPAIKGEEMAARPTRVFFRKGLVVFQMSLSFLLLVAAALFLRSLHNLLTLDPGFARENILVASVESGPGLDSRLIQEVKYLPGVISAALADSPPLGTHTGWNIFVPGYAPKPNELREPPWVGFVSPGYFTTMGIPLLLGRDIGDRDVIGARNVMIVNETFARHFFEGDNPIGRRVGTKEGMYDWEIIGVVKDSKYTGLREGVIRMIYVPARPGPWASRTVVHLRISGSPVALASALRQKIHDVDKTATVFDVHTVQEELKRSLMRERFVGTVTGIFGALALMLAIIGLYGLTAYGVAQRTHEFGIRIAIGARASNIVTLVVGEAMWLSVAGMAIGLAAAWVLGRVVESMLFGIHPADPVSAALAAVVLVTSALLAAWLPALRASRVDPIRALRYQ
jgi:putative ABC transport system permease protein